MKAAIVNERWILCMCVLANLSCQRMNWTLNTIFRATSRDKEFLMVFHKKKLEQCLLVSFVSKRSDESICSNVVVVVAFASFIHFIIPFDPQVNGYIIAVVVFFRSVIDELYDFVSMHIIQRSVVTLCGVQCKWVWARIQSTQAFTHTTWIVICCGRFSAGSLWHGNLQWLAAYRTLCMHSLWIVSRAHWPTHTKLHIHLFEMHLCTLCVIFSIVLRHRQLNRRFASNMNLFILKFYRLAFFNSLRSSRIK